MRPRLRLRQQMLAMTDRRADEVTRPVASVKAEKGSDRAGAAADDVERRVLRGGLRDARRDPHSFFDHRRRIQRVARLHERIGDAERAGIDARRLRRRNPVEPRDRLTQSAFRGGPKQRLAGCRVEPGEEPGDPAGAGIQVRPEGPLGHRPVLADELHRRAGPVAASLIPQRVARKPRSDARGDLERPGGSSLHRRLSFPW